MAGCIIAVGGIGAGMSAAVLVPLALYEPTAAPTRDALWYMAVSMYSNVRQAVFMPTCVVTGIVQQTYRPGGQR